jgi:hypothetical protein
MADSPPSSYYASSRHPTYRSSCIATVFPTLSDASKHPFPGSFLQISFASATLNVPHCFPVQVPPPSMAGAPSSRRLPRYRVHLRRRPPAMGPRAAKWLLRVVPMLPVPSSQALTDGSSQPAAPLPRSSVPLVPWPASWG